MSESRGPRSPLAERLVHWLVAILMGTCLVTAAILYNGSLMLAVGHRHLVELVHVWSGLALPVPMLVGAASAAYRSDVRRLNRFTPADWRWLRIRTRRDGTIPVGKFNAGQKINAWLVAGATGVLLGTGAVMYWTGLVRLSWRSGATFVHDWFALGLGLLVIGHIATRSRTPRRRAGHAHRAGLGRWAQASTAPGPTSSAKQTQAGSRHVASWRPTSYFRRTRAASTCRTLSRWAESGGSSRPGASTSWSSSRPSPSAIGTVLRDDPDRPDGLQLWFEVARHQRRAPGAAVRAGASRSWLLRSSGSAAPR